MMTTILIADQSSVDRMIIGSMLKGYELKYARNDKELFLELELNPDIGFLLLDVSLPSINSIEILKKIKTNPQWIRLRTIVMSGTDDTQLEIDALRLGAVDFVRKPMSFETLRFRIHLHENLRYMQDTLESNNRTLEKLVVEKTKELMATNRRMADTLNLVQIIFQQAPVGILLGNIRDYFGSNKENAPFVNPKYEEITGRSKEELKKIGWKNITHPDDIAKDIEMQQRLIRGDMGNYRLEKRYIRPDGSIRWVHLIAFPFDAQDSDFNHLIIAEDIQHLKVGINGENRQ